VLDTSIRPNTIGLAKQKQLYSIWHVSVIKIGLFGCHTMMKYMY